MTVPQSLLRPFQPCGVAGGGEAHRRGLAPRCSPKPASVLEQLGDSSPKTLHLLVIFFLVLALLTVTLSAGFSLYNSVSNPYQTFLGAVGVYTWSGLSSEYPGTACGAVSFGTSSRDIGGFPGGVPEAAGPLLEPLDQLDYGWGVGIWLLMVCSVGVPWDVPRTSRLYPTVLWGP